MKVLNKYVSQFKIIVFFSLWLVCPNDILSMESLHNDSIVREPSKLTHLLDNIVVPYDIIIEKGNKGELEGIAIYTDPKMAIRLYGEKYRNGIVFWMLNKKEE